MTATSNPLDMADDGEQLDIDAAGNSGELAWFQYGRCITLPEVVLTAGQRHSWTIARTTRLLGEVVAALGTDTDMFVTRGLRIELMGRWRLAREAGHRLALDRVGYPSGLLYRLLRTTHTVSALIRAEGAFLAADSIGRVEILINVHRANGDDRDFGALLADALTRASLMHGLTRAQHMRLPAAYGPRYDLAPDQIEDLRTALTEAEDYAGQAAAAEWIGRFEWTHRNAERARDLLKQLDDALHVDTPEDHARQYAQAELSRCYAEHEPDEVEWSALVGLRTWIEEHGTDLAGDGAGGEVDRRLRLAAAAWLDYQALTYTAATGSETEFTEPVSATQLGRHLHEFDVDHGTGRGERPADDPYWSATHAYRAYIRQEWVAAQVDSLLDQPEAVIRDYYTDCAPTEGTIADVHDLLSWNSEHRIESYPTGLPIKDERARRLRAAAFGDLLALQAEIEGSAEELAGFTNTAVLLAWDLRDFDAAHDTSRGPRGPRDLYWEASGLARAYTRQEWLSASADSAPVER